MEEYIVKLELRFHPEEQFFLCNKEFTEYVNYIYYCIDDDYAYYGKLYNSVTYYMYYSINGAIGLNYISPYNETLGYHPDDIEHVRIIYDKITKEPKFVYFSAHSQEGVWVEYSKCKKNGKYVIIYVSKFSHANRANAGTYIRMLGMANDLTSNYGSHIKPKLIKDDSIKNYPISNKEVFSGTWNPIIIPFLQKNITNLKEEEAKKEYEINKNAI